MWHYQCIYDYWDHRHHLRDSTVSSQQSCPKYLAPKPFPTHPLISKNWKLSLWFISLKSFHSKWGLKVAKPVNGGFKKSFEYFLTEQFTNDAYAKLANIEFLNSTLNVSLLADLRSELIAFQSFGPWHRIDFWATNLLKRGMRRSPRVAALVRWCVITEKKLSNDLGSFFFEYSYMNLPSSCRYRSSNFKMR